MQAFEFWVGRNLIVSFVALPSDQKPNFFVLIFVVVAIRKRGLAVGSNVYLVFGFKSLAEATKETNTFCI